MCICLATVQQCHPQLAPNLLFFILVSPRSSPNPPQAWDILRGDLIKFARRYLRRSVVENVLTRTVEEFCVQKREREEADRQRQQAKEKREQEQREERRRQAAMSAPPRASENTAFEGDKAETGEVSEQAAVKSLFSIKIQRRPGAYVPPLPAEAKRGGDDRDRPRSSKKRSQRREDQGRGDDNGEVVIEKGVSYFFDSISLRGRVPLLIPRRISHTTDHHRRIVSSSEASDASDDEARPRHDTAQSRGEPDGGDYSDDEDDAAETESAAQQDAAISSSDDGDDDDAASALDNDFDAEGPAAKRAKEVEDPAVRERRLALAREKREAKAARDAQKKEERAREREARATEVAREKRARRAAEQAEAARKRHETSALLEHYNAVRADALAEPLPPVLEMDRDGGATALKAAMGAVHATLSAMDAEDVEAAIAALDELHAHAKAHGEAWKGGNALLRGAGDLARLRASFPALLRACHRSVATPEALALLEKPPAASGTGAAATSAADDVQPHSSGAARAEGYYFVKASEKKDRLAAGRQQQPTEKRSKALVREPSRNNRREARQLASALAAEDLDSVAAEMVRLNALKVRRRHLRFGRSRIHEWGLFAMEDIPANAMVIEYVGEIIRQSVADDRERRYTDLGIGSSYLFRIDEQKIIDATRCGAIARFMNHSCDPNCYAQVVQVEGDPRIVIYSKRPIVSGTEITYDYKFPLEDEKILCHCGAATCRGTLN